MGRSSALGNAAALASLLLAGCSDAPPKAPDFSALEASAKTDNRFNLLEQTVHELQKKETQRDIDDPRTVWFQASGNKDFQFLDADVGRLAVSLQRVTPSGSGVAVHVNIGNPTTATIAKLAFSGSWGPLDKDGNPTAEEHQFKTAITTALPTGRWQDAVFTIDGAKVGDVGWVAISDATAKNILLAPGV